MIATDSTSGPQVPRPTAAKAPPKGKGQSRKKTKVALLGPGQDGEDPVARSHPPLEPFSIELNTRTRMCNAWKKNRETLDAENIQYTLAKLLPTKLDDMPVYDDRKFVVDHIDLVTSLRLALDPSTGKLPALGAVKSGKIDFSQAEQINHYVVYLRDSNKPKSLHLIMYDAHVSIQNRGTKTQSQRRNAAMRPGALTTDVCPTEADARRVALDACNKLDRVPMSLDKFNDPSATRFTLPMKRMIECLALPALRPGFLYSELHPEWVDLHGDHVNNREMNFYPAVMGHASLEHITRISGKTIVRMSFRACTVTGYSYLIRVYLHHYDKEKLRGIEDLIPEWFFAKCETWTGMITDEKSQKHAQTSTNKANNEVTKEVTNEADNNNDDAAGDEPSGSKTMNKSKKNATLQDMGLDEEDWVLYRGLARYMQYKVWGCAGDVSESQVIANHIGIAFEKADTTRHLVVEIANGKAPWGVSPSNVTSTIILPMAITNNAIKGGKLMRISFAGHSKIIIAYVQEQMLKTLAGLKGVLNAWTSGCEAADIVDNYMPILLSKAKIIAEYCQCKDVTERRQTNHYCMLDLNVYRCIDMVNLEDGRRVCKYCAENFGAGASDYHSRQNLNTFLKAMAYGAAYDEARLVEESMDTTSFAQALHAKCIESRVHASEDDWQDGYCGNKIRNIQEDQYATEMSHRHVTGAHRRHIHPLKPSIEAARPYIRVDGKTHVHHPDNILLTAFCINVLKGVHIAAILPWFRLAVENWAKEKDGEPRNERFWRAFHAAMDHAMIIRKEVPRTRKGRRNYKPTASAYQSHQQKWKSGWLPITNSRA
jgi:hypothetical protein